MSTILGVKNTTTQTLLTNSTINLGAVYRKFCKKINGVTTFSFNGNSINLNHQGIYHITATFVASGTEPGNITIQLLENGVATTGALSTETITTATTELRTLVIDYYVLVDSINILGCNTTASKTITFNNTGIGANITNLVVNVEKVA